jgi:DNA topoisomerase-1
MSKIYSITNLNPILVIVESPAKCKKIESYLGSGYECVASFGHLRQLKSLSCIDIENNFKPKFEIVDDDKKQKHIDFLRKKISSSDEVILATDDDREGEAIAWHICDLFKLPIETTKRIIFHEITEKAIQSAITYPKTIDMKKVNSQIARQVMDLLVGYKISPMLWKLITKKAGSGGLSAGRCQTPALKLVYENQEEINNTPPKTVYNTTGHFTSHFIPFELNKQFENETEITGFLEESVNNEHMFTRTNPEKVFKQQPEPLTTSRIQQLASNEMHISPKETMKICQTLYEDGYITYMRTDSKKYSSEFLEDVKRYLLQTYNDEKYIHEKVDHLSNTKTNTNTNTNKSEKPIKKTIKKVSSTPPPQEAHEAIRPTKISIQNLPDGMNPREKKLYKIIWETSLESCMAPAEYFSFKSNISTHLDNVKYSYTSELLDFLGWKIIKNKEQLDKFYHFLLQTKQNQSFEYKKITAKITIKNSKQHYTEAKLVQLLEDNGIGRPSTFSSLVDKIQERGYVKKEDVKGQQIVCKDFELEDDILTEINNAREFGNEKNKLIIQPLGVIVMEFLNKHFENIFNYEYTKKMEDELDKISKGEKNWYELCKVCLEEIDNECIKLKDENKCEIKIDDEHFYIIGKHGPVIKHIIKSSNKDKNKIEFLPVREGIDINKLERGDYKLEDIVANPMSNQIELGLYKTFPLILKKGKYGLYVTWGDNSKSLSCFGNRPIENVTLEDVLEILQKSEIESETNTDNKTSSIIRIITNDISIRNGKYGEYVFYKTSKMKKPMFIKLCDFKGDYKTCTIASFLEWLKTEHNIQVKPK